jgi:hypothetical protein
MNRELWWFWGLAMALGLAVAMILGGIWLDPRFVWTGIVFGVVALAVYFWFGERVE